VFPARTYFVLAGTITDAGKDGAGIIRDMGIKAGDSVTYAFVVDISLPGYRDSTGGERTAIEDQPAGPDWPPHPIDNFFDSLLHPPKLAAALPDPVFRTHQGWHMDTVSGRGNTVFYSQWWTPNQAILTLGLVLKEAPGNDFLPKLGAKLGGSESFGKDEISSEISFQVQVVQVGETPPATVRPNQGRQGMRPGRTVYLRRNLFLFRQAPEEYPERRLRDLAGRNRLSR
jgi:hypothetical protein